MNVLMHIWKQEKKITKEEIICLLVTFFVGIITYYQMPANWLTNPDTVWNSIYFRIGHGGEKANGRLLQIVVDKLRMNMVTPVLTTVLCVMLIAAVAFVMGRIFESTFTVKLLTGLILIFIPCTSSSLTYYYCAESFFLAFLCVMIGSYLVRKYPSAICYVLSVCLFTASLYLYQAYICIVFTLAIILLILDMLNEKRAVKEAITDFVRLAVTSGVAVLIYIITFKVIQIVLHMDVRTDRGLGFTGFFGTEGLISLLGQVYYNFFEYLFGNRLLNNEFGDRNIINIMVAVLVIGGIATAAVRNKLWKQPIRIVILIISMALFPLAVEAITVMTPEVDKYGPTGIIMIPTFALLYIFALMLGSFFTKQKRVWFISPVSVLVVAFFIWNSIVFTNLCINSMKLNMNKAQTVAEMMLDRIVEEYGYEKDTKLLVAGSMEDGSFPSLYGWPTQVIQGTSASYGFMWDTYTGNESCWIEFFKQYLGVKFESCDQAEYEELVKNREYINMPIFPADGSVKKFDNTIVVKMSDIKLD